jgi:flagellum-specific ATP synthase
MMAHALQQRIRAVDPVRRTGRVRRIFATHIEADGPALSLGALCRIDSRDAAGTAGFLAEVVHVDRESITLAPFDDKANTFPGAKVEAVNSTDQVPVGETFLGRAIDPLGRPIDGGTLPASAVTRALHAKPLSPLDRSSPREALETGLRAVDGLLPLAKGQRVGIFAPAGVGKTSLITQIATHVKADVVIVALIGERGREVEALWSGLAADIKARTTLVAATADQPATLRVRAGHYALSLAEHWRDNGMHVLLLLDSVTRLAMAMREIGLAAGEPPTVRAYTPNVFASMPRIVERAGAVRTGGAISAIMTVLSETEDIDDPLCEMMKSLLDGHILLSRALAEQGHFPAIDVNRSVSRQSAALLSPHDLQRVRHVTGLISAFEQSRMMRQAGLYVQGSDPQIDEAVAKHPRITSFLQQRLGERAAPSELRGAMMQITGAA